MVFGDSCERVTWAPLPQRGHNTWVKNHCLKGREREWVELSFIYLSTWDHGYVDAICFVLLVLVLVFVIVVFVYGFCFVLFLNSKVEHQMFWLISEVQATASYMLHFYRNYMQVLLWYIFSQLTPSLFGNYKRQNWGVDSDNIVPATESWGLEIGSPIPTGRSDMEAYTYNPNSEKIGEKTGRSLNSLDSHPRWINEIQIDERPCLKKWKDK